MRVGTLKGFHERGRITLEELGFGEKYQAGHVLGSKMF